MSPFNLRRILKIDIQAQELSNYTSRIFTECRINKNSTVWSTAKNIGHKIKQYIKSGKPANEIENIYTVTKQYNSIKKIKKFYQENRRPPIVGMSNLGILPIQNKIGSLKIKNVRYAGNFPILWAAPFSYFMIYYTFNDELNFNIGAAHSLTSKRTLNDYKQTFLTIIKEFLL